MRRVSATGGSAIKAVEVLKEHNVPEERIIFINLVSGRFPSLLYVNAVCILLGLARRRRGSEARAEVWVLGSGQGGRGHR